MELLLVMGVIGLVLLLGAAFIEKLVERPAKRRFQQRDHVAERKRIVVRNGFKTRAGIRQ